MTLPTKDIEVPMSEDRFSQWERTFPSDSDRQYMRNAPYSTNYAIQNNSNAIYPWWFLIPVFGVGSVVEMLLRLVGQGPEPIQIRNNMINLNGANGSNFMSNLIIVMLSLEGLDRDVSSYYSTNFISKTYTNMFLNNNFKFDTLPTYSTNPSVIKFQGSDSTQTAYGMIQQSIKESYFSESSFFQLFNTNMLGDISKLRYKKFNRLDKIYMSQIDYNYYYKDTGKLAYQMLPGIQESIEGYNNYDENYITYDGTTQGERYGDIRYSLGNDFFGTLFPIENYELDLEQIKEQIKILNDIEEEIEIVEYTEEVLKSGDKLLKQLLLHTLYPKYKLTDTITITQLETQTVVNPETGQKEVVEVEVENTYDLDFDNDLIGGEIYQTMSDGTIVFLNIDKLNLVINKEELYNKLLKYCYTLQGVDYTQTHLTNIQGITNDSKLNIIEKSNHGYVFKKETRSWSLWDEEIQTVTDGDGNKEEVVVPVNKEVVSGTVIRNITKNDYEIRFGQYITEDEDMDETTYQDLMSQNTDQDSYYNHIENIYEYPEIDSRELLSSPLHTSNLDLFVMNETLEYTSDSIKFKTRIYSNDLKSTYSYVIISNEEELDLDGYNAENNADVKKLEYNISIPMEEMEFKINNLDLYRQAITDYTDNVIYLFKYTKDGEEFWQGITRSIILQNYIIKNNTKFYNVLPSVNFSNQIYQVVTNTAYSWIILGIYISFKIFGFRISFGWGVPLIRITGSDYQRTHKPITFFNSYNKHNRPYFKNLGMFPIEWDRVENPDFLDTAHKIDNSRNISRLFKDSEHKNYIPRVYGTREGLEYKETQDSRYYEVTRDKADKFHEIWASTEPSAFDSYYTTYEDAPQARGVSLANTHIHFSFLWYFNEVVRTTRTLKSMASKYCDYLFEIYEENEEVGETLECKLLIPDRLPEENLAANLYIRRVSDPTIKSYSVYFEDNNLVCESVRTKTRYYVDMDVYYPKWADIDVTTYVRKESEEESYLQKNLTSTFINLLTMSNSEAETIYKKYVQTNTEEIIYNTDKSLSNTLAIINSQLEQNTLLYPIYFNLDDTKPIYKDDFPTDLEKDAGEIFIKNPNRIFYPNDHEIRIVKEHKLLIDNTDKIYTTTLDLSSVIKLKYTYIDTENKSEDEITTFLLQFKQQVSKEQSKNLVQGLITNLSEFNNIDLNQLLYGIQLYDKTTYSDDTYYNYLKTAINKDLYKTYIEIKNDILDFVVENYLVYEMFVFLKDDIIKDILTIILGSDYETILTNAGLKILYEDDKVIMETDKYDLQSIIAITLAPHTQESSDLSGDIIYNNIHLPVFEKFWSRLNYQEKKFIQDIGFSLQVVSPQVISSPNWHSIQTKFIAGIVNAVILIIISILLSPFTGGQSGWLAYLALAALVLSVISFVMTIISYFLVKIPKWFSVMQQVIGYASAALAITSSCFNIANIVTSASGAALSASEIIEITNSVVNIVVNVTNVTINIINQVKTAKYQKQIEEMESKLEAQKEEISDYYKTFEFDALQFANIAKTRNYYELCYNTGMASDSDAKTNVEYKYMKVDFDSYV